MKKSKSRLFIPVLVLLFIIIALICDYYYFGFLSLPFINNYDLSDIPGVEPISLPVNLRPIFSAKWSPRGDKIAIVSENREGQRGITEIYVIDLITEEIDRVKLNGETFMGTQFDWSPDGRRLAISGAPRNAPDQNGIWIANIENSDVTYLTEGAAVAWGPSLDELAVLHDKAPQPYLKMVNLTNLNIKLLYNFKDHISVLQRELDWYPSKDNIVFTITETDPEGYRLDRLYVLSLEDFSFNPVLPDSIQSMQSPVWLPDGQWFAFISSPFDKHTISVAPFTAECVLSWLPEGVKANTIDISSDGEKVVLAYFGKAYIADVEKLAGPNALPNELHCP